MAKNSMAKKKTRGDAVFENTYRERFGERWSELRAALLQPPGYVALEDGLRKPYYLDRASALSVSALTVRPGDRVLDLCAAPGGKSLALLSGLLKDLTTERQPTALQSRPGGDNREARETRGEVPDRPGIELIANERSRTRRARLQRTLHEHLPAGWAEAVQVTGHDARRWGLHEQNAYHHVIADVPCSAERHMLASPTELGRWSPARPKRLAIDSYAILSAAIAAARPGGTVLYLTCALLDEENDAVVAKALKRHGDEIAIGTPALELGVSTEFGLQVLPDHGHGHGPLYIALLTKRS